LTISIDDLIADLIHDCSATPESASRVRYNPQSPIRTPQLSNIPNPFLLIVERDQPVFAHLEHGAEPASRHRGGGARTFDG
jgi:hypothetical protein